MPIQVHGVLVHAMSGTELSHGRTEFRLRLPEPINKSPLESRGADIVMQSTQPRGLPSKKRIPTPRTVPRHGHWPLETRQWLFGTLTGAAPRELRLG
jgi:hypothetical protein